MAREPYSPVPGVEPTGPSGANLQIQANPSEFGALPARAAERFGQSAQEAGNTVMQTALLVQNHHNQVAVDDAFNNLQQKNLNRLFGDPNNPAQKGYFSLRGADAMNGMAPTVDGMEQDRQAIKNSLQNPAQQLLFEQQSRRMNMYQQESIGRHAAQQAALWDTQTQQAAEQVKLRAIGLNYNDDTDFQHNLADGISSARKKAASANGSPEAIQNAGEEFREKAYTERAMGIASTNPAAALQFLQRNQGQFNPATFDGLQDRIKTKARGVVSGQLADAAYTGGKMPVTGPDVQPAQQGLTPTKMMNGLIGTEGSGPNAVSPSGATGRAQIIRTTFNEYRAEGESYANEDDRRAAAKRYVDDMWKKYPGDAGRMAVGYFSGTGNIAPPGSPTPWKQDLSDGISTTSQYVNRLTNIVAPQVKGAAAQNIAYPDKNHAYQRILDSDADEQTKDAAISKLNMRYAIEDKAKKEASDAAESDWIPKIIKDPTSVNPDDVANDPRLALDPGKMKTIVDFQNARLRDNSGSKLSVVSHLTSTNLLNDIRRPEGDPQRITDMKPIYDAYINGALTRQDFEFAQTQFKENQTNDGQRLNDIQSKFLQAVKPTIEKSNPLMGQLDMTGGTEFFRLQQDIAQKVSQYRKDGKNPYDLFDPSKPDYIGKPESLAPYQKSIPESVSEFSSRMQQQAAEAAASSAPPAAAAAPSGPPPVGLGDFGYGPEGPAPAAQPQLTPQPQQQAPRRIPNLPMAPVDTGRKPSLDEIFGTPPASATPH